MKQMLICGADGFIGRNALEFFHGEYEITAVLFSDDDPKFGRLEGVKYICTDLRNEESVKNIFKDPRITSEVKDVLFKEDVRVAPETLRNTLTTLNEKINNQLTGSVTGETVSVGSLKKLASGIKEQLRTMPKEYLDALDEFNTLVKNNKKLLNNELISKITKVENNRLKAFGDEDLFSLSFKKGLKSEKYANELFNVIKDSPDAMKAYRGSINNFYTKYCY